MAWLAVWFVLVGLSLLGTLVDVGRHPNRQMPIMTWVWPLVALYFGPLGAGLYWLLSGRGRGARHVHTTPHLSGHPHMDHEHAAEMAPTLASPRRSPVRHTMPGMQDPLWMRSARSATHCMAGCALGDLVAMALIEVFCWTPFGSMFLSEVVLGAVLAFVFGLLLFQAFPVMAERGIGFGAALGIAFQADVVTIAAYVVGQIPAFYWFARPMMGGVAGHLGPSAAQALLAMQGSMAVGFVTTYPTNYWLVARGVKHGM